MVTCVVVFAKTSNAVGYLTMQLVRFCEKKRKNKTLFFNKNYVILTYVLSALEIPEYITQEGKCTFKVRKKALL